MNINSKTNIIGLLGQPVKHSFSPNIHNYLFKKYNQNNIYCCFDVEKNNLKDAMLGIKSLGILGCNITIPHKVDSLKYLDKIDKTAKLIGAINTIKNDNGILIGYNTDGVGFLKSILDKGYDIKGKKVMIIGAGGASRSISIELAYNNVKSIEIRNRTLENAKIISNIINTNLDTCASYSDKKITKEDLENIDILINTTPVGMENKECPVDESITVEKKILVCDIVYKPHNTSLINWAKDNRLDVVYGIDMLINQAIYAFYIWTGITAQKEDVIYLKDLFNNKGD